MCVCTFVASVVELNILRNYFLCFAEMRDYCQSEKLEAQCGAEEVVLMEHARYGRMQLREDG